MEKIYEAREYISKFYARYSRYINMCLKFLLGIMVFTLISNHVGFIKNLASPISAVGLSILCTFLPTTLMVVVAIAVVLIQFAALAPGIALISAGLMAVMFILYFRFSPGKSLIVLLTPLAFAMHVPMLIPIIFALVGGPVNALPISFGVMIFYMMSYVKSYAAVIGTVVESGIASQITTYTQQYFMNTEMWMNILSFAICLFVVYAIRRLAIDHSWEIAATAGALVHIIFMTFSHVMLDVKVVYPELVMGSVVAILITLVMKVFVFSVDYSRTEYLQFEDDEYYYYVKAVPKISVAVPEKTIKKINVRQESEETEEDEDVENVYGEKERRTRESIEEMKRRQKEEDSEIQKIIEQELKH